MEVQEGTWVEPGYVERVVMRSALKPSRETDGIKDMIVDFHW